MTQLESFFGLRPSWRWFGPLLLVGLVVALPCQTRDGLPVSNECPKEWDAKWVPVMVVGGAKLRPPDSPAAHIDPNVKNSPYAGVVSINTGVSGVLVSRYHVLTAAHAVDQNGDGKQEIGTAHVKVHFNHDNPHCTTKGMVVIAAKDIRLHPDFTGFNNPAPNDDLAIITLAAPAPKGVPIYPVFLGAPKPDFLIIMAGYGPTGTGDQGKYTSRFSFCTKRIGRNVASLYRPDDEKSGRLEMFQYDFDGPTKETDTFGDGPSLGNDVESIVSPGDSGGPSFLWRDANGNNKVDVGELIVFGVNTTIGGTINGYTPFGSFAAGALLSGYRDWILGIVPTKQLQIVDSSKATKRVAPRLTHVQGKSRITVPDR